MALINSLKRMGMFGTKNRKASARRLAMLELAARPVIESLETRRLLTVTYPTIGITGLTHTIPYQDSTPLTLDGTNFGSVDTHASAVDTFVVKNTGAGVLNLTGYNHVQVLGGTNPADFTVVTQPPSTLAPNTQSSFSIKFTPTTTGVETGTVTLYNDTTGANPFTFEVEGTGTQAPKELLVGLASKNILSGDTATIAADGTSFGSAESASGSVYETFTVKNSGSSALTFSGSKVAVSGANASCFTVSTNVTSSIAAGAQGTFVLKFAPGTAGVKVGTVTLTSNDPTHANYTFGVSGTGVNQSVIQLQGANSTPIATGDVSTISGDGTAFGSADLVNGSATHTFTILDPGANSLSLTGTPVIAITGATTEFSVVAQPAASVAAGGNETFNIKFAPGSVGVKTATVSIANNVGGTGHPFTFLVSGTGISVPTIQLSGGNGVNLANGQSAISTLNGTDFGSTEIANGSIAHTFVVSDLGSGALNFFATPIVITGAGASAFSVTTAPAATVPGMPVARAAATPTPVMPVGLNKEGHHAHAAALAAVESVAPVKLVRGYPVKHGHHHAASVSAPVVGTNPSGTPYILTFNPSQAGTDVATVTVNTNDPTNPTFSYVVTGTATASSLLVVSGANSATIASGDTTPITADGTDFGTADLTQTNSDTFTLTDTGSQTLNFTGGAVITGAGAADFSVTTDAPSTIASNASSNLVLAFNPASAGSEVATVTLTTDDPNSPYSFVIHGTGASVPIIAVSGNSNPIVAGTTTTLTSNDTNFGNAELNLGSVYETYTITNNGSGTMNTTGLGAHVTGVNSNDFSVTTAPATGLATTDTETFIVKFRPTAAGVRNAVVDLTTNDSVSPTYAFAVSGTAVHQPAETLTGNGNAIAAGATTTVNTNGTDFGSVDPSAGGVSTYTIHNLGSTALDISSISIAGDNASDWSVLQQPRVSVAAGATTVFSLKFIPTGQGAEDTTVTLNSDDPTNPAYSFEVTGTATLASHITVEGTNLAALPATDTTPLLANGTDFGQAVINNGTVSNTFTIANTGGASLTLTNPVLSGTNAGDFSIATEPTSPVVATTGTTTFVVKFAPTVAGSRTATVTLTSNDPNTPTETFVVHGTGITAPLMVVKGNGVAIPNNNATPDTTDGSDFGSVEEANGTVTDTFTIQNTGSASLTLTGAKAITIAGANSNDFTVVTQPSVTIAASGSETFQIKFKPTALGERTASVTIASSDPTTSPYTFNIQGDAVAEPVIQLLSGTHTLSNGQSASLSDGTNMGSAANNNGTLTETFSIKNIGSAVLDLNPSDLVDLSGANSGDFVVTTPPTATVAAGATTTFVITFSPTNVGAENALVTIGSNDPNGAYTFNIAGTGT